MFSRKKMHLFLLSSLHAIFLQKTLCNFSGSVALLNECINFDIIIYPFTPFLLDDIFSWNKYGFLKDKMKESLELFETIVNSEFFQHTQFMLFFNKKDLFQEKLQHSDLHNYFTNYDGIYIGRKWIDMLY